MTLKQKFLAAAAALAVSAGTASADPAVIYDLGGKFDKSFNEAAYNGAERWAKETGGTYKDIEIQSEAQREQAVRRMAQAGFSPIITTGFAIADIVGKVAKDFPDTKFVNIDGFLPDIPPNVELVAFREDQGSYLVGMLAAMADKSGTVGFIGGMDVPLIRKFACGYAQGVKAVKPDAKVISNMTGTTGAAWNDPVKGGELTKAQIAQGADVVFAAAGGTGIGVLQTAADDGILSIGVDSNQNYLHPGQVLTSMVKRVDVATYDAMKAGKDLKTGGFKIMDLANHGVGFAYDQFNQDLISYSELSKVYAAAADIVSGKIKVHDYTTDNTCPDLSSF